MNPPEPDITVNVDLTNPGQFFACCGLLELADRVYGYDGAEVKSAFTPSSFTIYADHEHCSLKDLIPFFTESPVEKLDPEDNAASRLFLGTPFNIRLDWWYKMEQPDKQKIDLGGGDQLKTWAGKQKGPLIFTEMKAACKLLDHNRLLSDTKAVYDTGKAKPKKTISPFYFDARRAGTALDIGFSPDEQDMSVMASPAVESLALVGLQRFRPAVDEQTRTRSFLYAAWATRLPAAVASATVSQAAPTPNIGRFRFTKPSRGGEYLTMFSRATPERYRNV